MNPLKKHRQIKIIPDKINNISTGVIISSTQDSFVAEINKPSTLIPGQEQEILISEENFIILFNSKVNKITDNNVHFFVTSKMSFIQKREYPRINVDIPATLRENSNADKQEVKIVNIGGGGMQIHSSRKFSPNSLLNVCFKLSDKKEISTPFKILRVNSINEKEKEKEKFILSGKFDKITNFDKISVIQFCFKRQLETNCKKPKDYGR